MTDNLPALNALSKRRIYDAIRASYDIGYSDARNASARSGDGAPGYMGRDIEKDHGDALLSALNAQLAASVAEAAQSLPDVSDEFRELLREARDNCQASIAESGISRDRTEYRKELFKRLSAALAASPAQPVQPSDPWLPIETAPKDGTEIIMSNGKDVSAGSWFKGHDGTYDRDGAPNCDEKDACWMDWSGGMLPEPTHWMPLPAQPKD